MGMQISLLSTFPILMENGTDAFCHTLHAPPSDTQFTGYPSTAYALNRKDELTIEGGPISISSVYSEGGVQAKECKTAAANSKNSDAANRTERGKGRTSLHLELEDLKPHFGKRLKDVAKALGVGRSTVQHVCRSCGIHRWPYNEQQKRNPSLFEAETANEIAPDLQKNTVRSGAQAKECNNAAANSKKNDAAKRTEGGMGRTSLHLEFEDLKHHFGKRLKDVAEALGVGRSTIKRVCRSYGIHRWPYNEQHKKNPSLFEAETANEIAPDSQQNTGRSGAQVKECNTAAANSKKNDAAKRTKRGKRRTRFHIELKDLEPHLGKSLSDAAKALGVGRSTIKRLCRNNGIRRWPSNEQHKNIPSFFEAETANETALDSQENMHPFTSSNLLVSQIHGRSIQHVTDQLEAEKMLIKVKYEDDIIKFHLHLSSGMDKLLEEVAMRLNLKLGGFKLKYLDEDNDEILLACDADLLLCSNSMTRMGKSCLQLFVQLST